MSTKVLQIIRSVCYPVMAFCQAFYVLIVGYLCCFRAHGGPGFYPVAKEMTIVMQHNTARLECAAHNIDDTMVVMWRRDNGEESILFVGDDSMGYDDRYRLDHRGNNYTLIIQKAAAYDSGDYLCIITTEPQIILRQRLQVQVPPSVSMIPDVNPLVIKPNQALHLTCYGAGNPPPQITWRKVDNKDLPGGRGRRVTGKSLNYAIVNETIEGSYECTAKNGVGAPVSKQIAVVFHFKPKLESQGKYIIVHPGQPSNISCRYKGKPIPSLSWLFAGYPLKRETDKYQEYTTSDADGWLCSTLQIADIRMPDLGDYTCYAHSSMGARKEVIHLTSVPGIAQVEVLEGSETSSTLRWFVESHLAITEYKIKYRLLGTNIWKHKQIDEIPKKDVGIDGIFRMTYILEDLRPASKYEVNVAARNGNGWGGIAAKPVIITTNTPSTTTAATTTRTVTTMASVVAARLPNGKAAALSSPGHHVAVALVLCKYIIEQF